MKPVTLLLSISITAILIVTIAGCGRDKGCTDPTANNYNQNAKHDDGSCIYRGCTDASSTNYNPKANQDDGSCKYQGNATFYSLNYGPTVTVTIDTQTAVVPQFFTSSSDVTSCNTQGCANFTLPAGNYNYTASSSLFTWSGSITVDPNGCSIIELDNPNTTFYSPTFISNITVTIGGVSDTVKQLYTTSPGCSAAGCANFFLTSGNYPYTATDGTRNWSGNLVIDETTCNSIELQ